MISRHPATYASRLTSPDGASIAFEVTGNGPALLFAHGLGGNQLSWWQQIPAFCGRYTCVAFSHRGFSPSTMPGGLPDPKDYADDAIALLDHLDIDRAALVGQSMGGWTGVELALARPDRLAGLVLASTTGTLNFDCYDDADVAEWRRKAPKALEELAAAAIHPAAGHALAAEQPALHALYCAIDRINVGLDKEEIGRRIRAIRTRGPDDAVRIRCPTLFIAGEDDVVIAPAGIRAVARRVPKARVVSVPATGHSVYFERPALFNTTVARFLDEIGWV
jgi:3-oxoadipate enol-lactonase